MPRPRKLPNYKCPQCGTMFPPKWYGTKFCSTSCANRSRAGKKVGRVDHWRQDEDDLILKHYTAKGPRAMAEMLPGRTANAISNRAQRLDVRYFGYVKRQQQKIPTFVPEMNLPPGHLVDEHRVMHGVRYDLMKYDFSNRRSAR